MSQVTGSIQSCARALLPSAVVMRTFFGYLSGSLLRRHHFCPWDYSSARANVNGLIRLDYAPFWLGAGLLFERILVRANRLT